MSALAILAALGAGAIGALLRYGITQRFAGRPNRLPWAVLIVNAVGSAIGGTLLGLSQTGALADDARLILLSGFCGGLTTFSTFSVETIQLALEGRTRAAVVSVGANLLLGIGLATAAWALVTALGSAL